MTISSYTKNTISIQFSLICCILFSKFSKQLEFLSFHMVHQMLAGIILPLFLFLACEPVSSQLRIAFVIFPGIDQDMPLRFKNNLHNYLVPACIFFSDSLPYRPRHDFDSSFTLDPYRKEIRIPILSNRHLS